MIRLKTGFSTLLISLLMSSVLWASDPVWIDVRSSEEYAAGHVELAVNIPYTEIGSHIGEVTQDKDALIYVYCRSGRRAGIAMDTLNEMGYMNVVNLESLENAQAQACEKDQRIACN